MTKIYRSKLQAVSEIVRIKCDMCEGDCVQDLHADSYDPREEFVKNKHLVQERLDSHHYTAFEEEISIKFNLYARDDYPDGSHYYEKLELDICTDCFHLKVLPFLYNNGLTKQKEIKET